MSSVINTYIRLQQEKNPNIGLSEQLPLLKCRDGFTMEVRIGRGHYCIPEYIDGNLYTGINYACIECSNPNRKEKLLMKYAEYAADKGIRIPIIYLYVPIEIVDKIIKKHGGLIC